LVLQELPQKREEKVLLDFDPQQKELYRDVALSWNHRVKESIREFGAAKSQLLMLTALLRLRQICSHPGSVDEGKYVKKPPKMQLLLESLKEIVATGDSALVFTQFIFTLKYVYELLKKANLQVYVLHGQIPRHARAKIISDFQEGAHGKILVMTLKTGGVGLNLCKANHIFHLEPWWNPHVENQGTDRGHRIGQEKEVRVYRYIMKDSVEEKIEFLKQRKMKYFTELFNHVDYVGETSQDFLNEAEGKRTLSKEDFDALLL